MIYTTTRVLQINLNRSQAATENALQLAIEYKVDILFIQEHGFFRAKKLLDRFLIRAFPRFFLYLIQHLDFDLGFLLIQQNPIHHLLQFHHFRQKTLTCLFLILLKRVDPFQYITLTIKSVNRKALLFRPFLEYFSTCLLIRSRLFSGTSTFTTICGILQSLLQAETQTISFSGLKRKAFL